MSENGGLLSEITVLDLTEGAAGPFATKFFADYGARVIKIERPGRGDPARREGPFGAREDAGALFLYANTGKESVTLDLATNTGRLMLLELVEHADALVESWPTGALEALGLGEAALHQRNPRLIVTSVSAFGRSGPYAGYRATELTAYASGGQQSITGEADREPLMPAGRQGAFQTGMHAFGATLAGLYSVGFLEVGQNIEIATMEALASTLELYLGDYVYFHREILTKRRGNIVSSTIGIFPCADGYAGIHVMPRNFASFAQAMDAAWMTGDEKFKDQRARLINNDEMLAAVYGWAASKTRGEIYALAGEHRTTMAPVLSIGEALSNAHFRERESFRELDGLTYPGPAFRPGEGAWELRPAPRLGEHNVAVYGELLGLAKRDIVRLRAAGVI
ncbi:MAG: CoA transferase [Dehalococcoidia bacterium]